MEISSLHTQLKQGQLNNFYIFTGPEWAVQKIYINQIAKLSGKEVKYIDQFKEVVKTTRMSGFVSKNFVYVARDDKDIMTEEKAQQQIKNGVLGNNILILLITSVDKRLKFYKAYKDSIVEFEPLKPAILKKYLMKEINLNDRNFEILMEICEYDYGRCLLEIDKMKRTGSNAYDQVFKKFLEDGTIYIPPRDAIFDFVDTVLDRKVNDSYELYNECLQVGEAVMVMLSVLYNNAKAVLQVQSCESSDVSKSTGLTGWQIRNAKAHCGKYRNGELVNLMQMIHRCEKGIKTGTMEEQYVMDYILTSIL